MVYSFNSNHSKNCLKSIASSENNLHNCRNSNITKRQLEELKNLLIIQEYIKDVVTQGIKKALVVPSEVLLSEKTKEKKQVLSFISTYNPNNPKLFQLIRNLFGSWQQSSTARDILEKYKSIDCKRQPANLTSVNCSPKLPLCKESFTGPKCEKNYFCCHYTQIGSKFRS